MWAPNWFMQRSTCQTYRQNQGYEDLQGGKFTLSLQSKNHRLYFFGATIIGVLFYHFYFCPQNSSTYWEGRSDMETLQRIYGISFPDSKMLKEWERFQEEAKTRDHRKIGKVSRCSLLLLLPARTSWGRCDSSCWHIQTTHESSEHSSWFPSRVDPDDSGVIQHLS